MRILGLSEFVPVYYIGNLIAVCRMPPLFVAFLLKSISARNASDRSGMSRQIKLPAPGITAYIYIKPVL